MSFVIAIATCSLLIPSSTFRAQSACESRESEVLLSLSLFGDGTGVGVGCMMTALIEDGYPIGSFAESQKVPSHLVTW
jgi:hypothetical protein